MNQTTHTNIIQKEVHNDDRDKLIIGLVEGVSGADVVTINRPDQFAVSDARKVGGVNQEILTVFYLEMGLFDKGDQFAVQGAEMS